MIKLKHLAGLLLICFLAQALADATTQPMATPATAPAVNTAPTPTSSSELSVQQLPNFQSINLAAFEPAMTTAIQACNDTITTALQKTPSWDNTMQPVVEQLSKIIALWDLLLILNSVQQSDQTKTTVNTLLPKVAAFHSNLLRNQDLYNALVTISNSKDFSKLSATQQITLKQTIQDYQLSGTALAPAQQQRYAQIIQHLRELAMQFNNNLATATNTWQYNVPAADGKRLDGIPDFILLKAADLAKAQGKSGWILTLDNDCLVGVESYAKDRNLRETVYTAFATLAPNNSTIVAETLQYRQELATLLDFNNFADYASVDRQPPDPNQAMQFLQDLTARIKPAAANEYAQLQAFAKKDHLDKMQAWDVAYYAQWSKAMLAADSQIKSKDYLHTNVIVQDLFNLASILFNINFNVVADASTWDPDVKLYTITDVQSKPIAYVYLDLYARSGKNPNNRTQMYLTRLHAKQDMLPVAVMSTNLLQDGTGYIRHEEIVKLFDEFGNMLQRCLATLDYPSFSRSNGMTWDAIALSSQFMQNWAWQKEFLLDITAQKKTGAKMPDTLIQTLINANNFDAAINLLQQLQIAMFDLRSHLNLPEDKGKSALAIFKDIRKEYDVLPTLDVDNFPNRFSETFTTDYAATYYTYYWDKSLADDAFAAFIENGIFSAKIGHKFRDNILLPGGQASVLDLFKNFRGRAPEVKYMLTQEGIN